MSPDIADGLAQAPHVKFAPAGADFRLAGLSGRTRLDGLAARLLRQAAAPKEADVAILSHLDLTPGSFAGDTSSNSDCVILNLLDFAVSRAPPLHIPRIKRAAPKRRIGVILWQAARAFADTEPLRHASLPIA